MRALILLPALLLAACGDEHPCLTPPPAPVEVRTITVDHAVPVACIRRDQIPAEPVRVGDQLTGQAKHDLHIIAPSASDLRLALETTISLLEGCAQ